MGESSKFPKSWIFETPILKLAVCPLNSHNSNGQMYLDSLYIKRKTYYNLPNLAFWGWLSMESQPQNHEFRNNSLKILNLGIILSLMYFDTI